jgi:hypothetical protein
VPNVGPDSQLARTFSHLAIPRSLDQSPLVLLARNGEDVATLVGAGRLLKLDILEKGMDSREAYRLPATILCYRSSVPGWFERAGLCKV